MSTTVIKIPSVQRVRPRGAAEYISFFVQVHEDGDEVATLGVWRGQDELAALNAKLLAAGEAPMQIPALKRMLVDTEARSAVANELMRALQVARGDEKLRNLLCNFFDVQDLPGIPGPAAKKTNKLSVPKTRVFLLKRLKARVLLQLYTVLQKVRQALGISAGSLLVASLLAAWMRRMQIRNLLFGALLGMAATAASYEVTLQEECKSAQTAAQDACKHLGKAVNANDDNTDFKLMTKAIEAEVEAKYAPEGEDGGLSEEEVAAAAAADKALVEELDNFDAEHQHNQAWSRVQDYLEKPVQLQSYDVLWRAARSGYYVANIMKVEIGLTDPTRLATLKRALDIIEDLLERFEDRSETHKYYALIAQEWTNHQGNKEKIIGGFTFEKHTLRAIELNDNDPTLHFMYGMFCFEVAKLSWAERMGAKAVFGREPPKTTFEQALSYFQRAHKLRNPDLLSLFEIARCQDKLKNKDAARAAIQELYSYPREESNPEYDEIIAKTKKFEAELG
mmetsp:Transcript_13709/g.26542  ORF Transcript_13709/g.26542 Transcript_13709/m.26542 type:complete len:507 (-) Transcript_13709:308-1828(-)|eukprot:CAMPEP_0171493080 /NCGR_PEP_ID=MMETSP0958-20121227/4769_1 /TAXON_ID=87120 /ORGANISM="Aurantiochytrium limacinum, Strain ATCCMYA-1381" /LENGTH=506 /DNA_ID=CAMNT_0012026675 /DNA_START=8 /DNA_END=1528 /DNA_ORIENTATION=-